MADPTTRRSTPPQSARIAQQSSTGSVVLSGYADTAFPAIAFVGQLAINLTNKTLEYYDANGAWQGVLGSADVQSYYGPVAPTIGVNAGDRWFNTSSELWSTWNDTANDWMPGDAAYSTTAPTSPGIGQPWFNIDTKVLSYWNGTSWVLGSDPTAPGVYSGAMPSAAVAGSTWVDSAGLAWVCKVGYISGGTLANWMRVVYAGDPLVAMIQANGDVIVATELTHSPPAPHTSVAITTGLVWLDIQRNSNQLGNFYIYNGSVWKQAFAPNTIELCLALVAARHYSLPSNTDEAVATTTDATATLFLTFVPIVQSLTVYQNGVALRTSEYSLSSHVVTIPPSSNVVIEAGDFFEAHYWYNPTIEVSAATASVRGGTAADGNGVVTNFALPSATVLGDLLVVSAGGTISIADSRLTPVGNCMWIGFATSLAPIAASSAGGSYWGIACVALNTNAVAWTAAQVNANPSMINGATLATPQISGIACTVSAQIGDFAVVDGNMSTPTGYTYGVSPGTAKVAASLDLWDNSGALGTSPAGPSVHTGGTGSGGVTVVGLVGP